MMEQLSEEWFAARVGKVTASRMSDVTARTKGGSYGAGRRDYLAELVIERLTGKKSDRFQNADMQWGVEQEEPARFAYVFRTDNEVAKAPFIDHPSIPMTGASPDGLIGAEGCLEIKCPKTATHLETLRTGTIDTRYIYQMQWQMICAGRAWCDFVSFDPRMPESMQLFIKRVPSDDRIVSELTRETMDFLAELDVTVSDLRTRFA